MMIRLAVFFGSCLLLAAAGRAAEPPEPRWNITAECQMVTLPQKLALPLIASWNDESTAEAAWKSVQELIASNQATLVGNLLVKGKASTKLTTESVEDFRYPTEFDPPQLPSDVPKDKIAEVLKSWPVVGITPTSFETRNVGTTLELSAEVSADGAWISAEYIPSHVRLLRMTKYDSGVLPSGEHLGVEQPQFMSLKNSSTLTLRSGQRVLVGVHKLPDVENVFELFVLRVTATKTGQ